MKYNEKIGSQDKPSRRKRKLAAIMFTDIVGYTTLMSKDEEKAHNLVQRNRDTLKLLIKQFNGEWLKEIGDGTLSSFESAVEAVKCAIEIQRSLRDDPDLKLRIGIHIGDVVFEAGDVFGHGVNVASRIEPLAEPGEICISKNVYEKIKNFPGIKTVNLGVKELKNVEEPLEVYKVVTEGAVPVKTEKEAIAPRAKRIAVLPFYNFSEDKTDEYFSDGITEDIITQLSKINSLRVISRTSIMQYKKTTKPLRQIGAELGVGTILEGSVRRVENRVRISSQLIDAKTDEHLWVETYDRNLSDIFAIQSDVAQQIARALKATLSPEEKERIEQKPTDNLEAYDYYLQGRQYAQRSYGRKDLEIAIELSEKAVTADANFAEAHAWMTLQHSRMYWWF